MKPTLPQGTRDFGADVVRKRQYILNVIRNVFELYGFEPLETPALENLETLTGKYGDEGDKLIFKILNNGLDNPAKEQQVKQAFEKMLQGKNNKELTERALKYDLTIPFARYVAMNHGQLTFPFKRYQMQPVWRADRPQRGRYREFYQCDADVVGSNSLINEVEFINIYREVFAKLKIENCALRINSRKILSGLAEICGGVEKMLAITIAIDKLDKIGLEKVKAELSERSLTQEQINIIEKYLNISGTNTEKIDAIKDLLSHSDTAKKGIAEIEFVLSMVEEQSEVNKAQVIRDNEQVAMNNQESEVYKAQGTRDNGQMAPLIIDFTLARGLNYYTGIIFEAKAPASVTMGSIGGGGRYDDLTGLFGVPDLPGVGISFGVDRIYDVMEELQLFPDDVEQGTKVLFLNLGLEESKWAFSWVQELRKQGIASELFHEPSKKDKQFKYAEKKNIPYVASISSNEKRNNTCTVKNIRTGNLEILSLTALCEQVKNNLI